ncbi:50S ribosomal protein L1 [Candidatus Omnitrophus magneticus]|uniref:Large ribosomal subunit protein uL1 n=1 Tax=Candidatus Omnitrophus magneticus TaxID=1609969 RepID=A0A0F0CS20_9BACT|nr:50S ribosomal protein L1 [Candidatus Omnitrophus magneticus]
MTKNISKRAKAISKLTDKKKEYTLSEAVDILKKTPSTKFDQSVEVDMKLTLDQANNPIRGTVSLPNGTGKTVKVAVFCKGDFEKEAKEAGADYVGSDDLMKKVADGWCDFDIAVSTPDLMRDMAKLGKVLGPKGLMPNPKSGTVTKEIGKIVKELKAGKIEFRMDKLSGIKASVGKLSFKADALIANVQMFITAVLNSNPKVHKAQAVKSIYVSSTMGPGIKLEKGQFKQG